MKKTIAIATALFMLTLAAPSAADTLIIKFKSGAVQKVTLREGKNEVESIEFSADSKAEAISSGDQKASDKGGDTKDSPRSGSGIRFKWAEPKIGE